MVTRFVRTSVSAAMSAAAILAMPALAAPVTDGQSAIVRIADLDLATDAGVQTLHARVAQAAKAVCGAPDARDLLAVRQSDACRRVALESAAPQVQLAIADARPGKALAMADRSPRQINLH
ncbi:UrcA family protein [Sphingomonas oligoaromativorans]|uniref:UrcA family protein n=1 Tax=Sphingomonas oligoaromativorans TaxID=575322 RepID=UPI00141F60F6|nr:UrcA family protein [Sphingomonas oligoaromativorans]NIJ33662.1 UrcA family protein [Sphingomonas oligoaromativorans]